MQPISIWFFGVLRVQYGGEPFESFHSKKARALLCYLALADRPTARTILADLLWPDLPEHNGRMNLRRALSNLRQLVGDGLKSNREQVELAHEGLQIDVWQFLQIVTAVLPKKYLSNEDIVQLRHAVALYNAPFLEGFHLPACPDFEQWLTSKRIACEQLLLQSLTALADYYWQQNDYRLVLHYAEQAIQQEPWHEQSHRKMMLAYFHMGNRAAALAQYEQCYHYLETELNIEPEEETKILYQQIVGAERGSSQRGFATNVPLFPPFFVGRDAELKQLTELLNDPHVRVLTILGFGGMGKTRLAVQLLRQKVVNTREAVFVSLAAVTIPPDSTAEAIQETIAVAILKHLTAMISASESAINQLLTQLHGRHVTLLLDNFEPLLTIHTAPSVVTLIQKMLRASDGLTLLITSRTPLHLRIEWLFDLHGLSLPNLDAEHMAEQLETPSVQLFVQTARRLTPSFRPQSGLPVICEICHFVQGIPLALELAAALTRQHTLPDILQRLQQTVDALRVNWHDVPRRQQSIRATFEYSWLLLTPDAARLLAALSCFQQPFTAGTLSMVLGQKLAAHLPTLVSQSLVGKQNELFSLHALIQGYAAEKLAEMRPFADVAYAAHARHFLGKLALSEEQLINEHLVSTTASLDQVLADIKQAWFWAIEQQDISLLAAASQSLTYLFINLQRIREGEQLLAAAADQFWPLAQEDQIILQATILFSLYQGRLVIYRLGVAEVEALLQTVTPSLKQFDVHAHPDLFAKYQYLQGMVAHHSSDWSRAREHLRQAADYFAQAGNVYRQAFAYFQIGNGYLGGRQWEDAQQIMQTVVSLVQTVQNLPMEAKALATIAMAYRQGNAFELGDVYHQRAQSLAQQIQWSIRDQLVWNMIGSEIAIEQGDFSAVSGYLDEALQLLGQTTAEPYKGDVFELYGHLYLKQGLYHTSYQYFDLARQQGILSNKPQQELKFLLCLCTVAYLERNIGRLQQHISALNELATQIESRYFLARGQNFMGLAYLLEGKPREALAVFQENMDSNLEPLEQCETWWGMSMAYHALNQSGNAADVIRKLRQMPLFPHLRRTYRSCILADLIYEVCGQPI